MNALAYGDITAEQQARMDKSAALIAERRAFAQYDPIMDKRQPIAERVICLAINPDGSSDEQAEPTGEINCARCTHLSGFNSEHERGWCTWRRRMVSTWHPARCKAFQVDA